MKGPSELNLKLPEALGTAEDVARFFKVSRSWVYHRAQSGKLPSIRVGGLLRFDMSHLRVLADAGKIAE